MRENSGLYFLLIRLQESYELKIAGKEVNVPRGYYIYTGSAQKNLASRIERHCRKEKKKHWHIDYLLEFAEVIDVKILPNVPREKEDVYAEKWLALADFVPVRKFGASDSTAESHLTGFYTKKKIIQSELWNKLKI